MANYIAPEYEDLEKKLSFFSKEHDLDQITISSLIRGSIEILEPEIPTASVSVIDANNLSGQSVKIKNIKVNLKFALNSIFSFKTVYDAKGIWLILAVLKAVMFLVENMKIEFDKKDALVLFCLYRLKSATLDEIVRYMQQLRENEKEADMQIGDVNEALEKLERAGTVKLEDGKYLMCETILIRKS